MAGEGPGELTLLLQSWSAGDPEALNRLIEQVYPTLREIAGKRMLGERVGHTLQATALVNEAVMKLMELTRMEWKNREQLYACEEWEATEGRPCLKHWVSGCGR